MLHVATKIELGYVLEEHELERVKENLKEKIILLHKENNKNTLSLCLIEDLLNQMHTKKALKSLVDKQKKVCAKSFCTFMILVPSFLWDWKILIVNRIERNICDQRETEWFDKRMSLYEQKEMKALEDKGRVIFAYYTRKLSIFNLNNRHTWEESCSSSRRFRSMSERKDGQVSSP